MAVNDPKTIAWVLERPRVLAVVGLSDNPERPSHRVSKAMQQRGYRIVPVTPKGGEILGEKVYASLTEIPFPVDVVQVFRAPQYAVDVVREVAQMKAPPRVLWMQEGVVNDQAVAEAEALGLAVVQDRCLYKEAVRAGR
ncbi:putative CoA-binding protein [Symbiobacterium terraclitae]|uniref:CoA-binding protein n=1 Tax=Symbiobacterium terraclitae TaxID=557451 RepID=A0ABS4JQU5_9FIRM|nr:CoA-binding protein [Symbiobacterium terraclitae]MBP2017908.1 putative CoA-binding protein [Symbiobacterium terraclitae]